MGLVGSGTLSSKGKAFRVWGEIDKTTLSGYAEHPSDRPAGEIGACRAKTFKLFDSFTKRRLDLADLRWTTLEFVNHLLYLVPVPLALLVLLALLALGRAPE